jgi:hypothetical protein
MWWLKENTYFARADSGSFLLSYHALLRLDETVARDVVDAVMPALTAGRSFRDASAQLPPEQLELATDLLGILRDHDLMAPRAARSSKPAELREGRSRDRSLVITGDDAFATDLAAALQQCGLRVRVVAPARADTEAQSAVGLAFDTLALTERDNGLLCHVAANDDGVCWSIADSRAPTSVPLPPAALHRSASFGATTHPDSATTKTPHKAMTTIAAQQIAHSVLRPNEARLPAGAVTFLDRRTLRTSTHAVTVHPYDVPAKQRTRDEFRRYQRELQNDPPLRTQDLAERWRRLSDERFGAFAELDDTRLRQLPLKVTAARMSDPCGLASAPHAVVGVGIDKESAQERAIVEALAAYGSIVVDPRLLVDKNGTFLGPREGDARQLLRPVRAGSVDAFVRAIDLTNQRERLLPAHHAFPVLRAPESFRTPCGTSAALEWRQALAHGLLQHCVRLTVAGSSRQPRQPAVLATEDFDDDSGVRFLTTMVKAAGLSLTLHDITGPAGIPVVACASAFGGPVYGGGASLVEAVREALTAALLYYQRRSDPVLKAVTSSMPATWTNPASSASLNPGQLVAVLTGLGYTPSVFALDHDRVVHEAFPCVLRVMLERGEVDLPAVDQARLSCWHLIRSARDLVRVRYLGRDPFV